MNTSRDERVTQSRKAYTKPKITQVVLRAEEAVLGSCKTTKKAGPGQPKCSFPSTCSSIGS